MREGGVVCHGEGDGVSAVFFSHLGNSRNSKNFINSRRIDSRAAGKTERLDYPRMNPLAECARRADVKVRELVVREDLVGSGVDAEEGVER